MIAQSFYIFIFVEIINFLALIALIYIKFRNPLREIYFVIIAIVSVFIGYLSYLINVYYSTNTYFDTNTEIFVRLGYLFTMLGIFFIGYTVLLIDFKPNYKFLFVMTIYIATTFSSVVYNALSFGIGISNKAVYLKYNSLGLILILLFYFLNAIIWFNRILTISRMMALNKYKKNIPLLVIFGILALSILGIYVITELILKIGGGFNDILNSFLVVVFIVCLVKNDTFPFLTPIKLDAVIIYDNLTSIKLFSHMYNSDLGDQQGQLLGSLFSTLNSSLGETIKSEKNLNQLYFEDKVVLISPGNFITTLLVVSKNNFVSQAITDRITLSFEKKYHDILSNQKKNKTYSFNIKSFTNFDQEMSYFSKFFPL